MVEVLILIRSPRTLPSRSQPSSHTSIGLRRSPRIGIAGLPLIYTLCSWNAISLRGSSPCLSCNRPPNPHPELAYREKPSPGKLGTIEGSRIVSYLTGDVAQSQVCVFVCVQTSRFKFNAVMVTQKSIRSIWFQVLSVQGHGARPDGNLSARCWYTGKTSSALSNSEVKTQWTLEAPEGWKLYDNQGKRDSK